MVLDDDSPLRKLPTGLDPGQALALDGLRLTAEMALLAYQRLSATALRASEEDEVRPGTLPLLFSDAWAFVDHVNRFRTLLLHVSSQSEAGPGPLLSSFCDDTRTIQDLRDTVQHLTARIPGMVAAQQGVLGTLTWVYVPDLQHDEAVLVYAVPGGVYPSTSNSVRVYEVMAARRAQVDQLTLSTWQPRTRAAGKPLADHTLPSRPGVTPVSLTKAVERMIGVIHHVEETLRPQFEGHSTWGADMLVKFAMR